VSRAKPMGCQRREALYKARWTPRKARRYHHKRLRAENDYEPVFEDDYAAGMRPKGRPTPRREGRPHG
jgi:hypothetical protein